MRGEVLGQIEEEHVVNAFIELVLPLLIDGSPILKARACAAVASYVEDLSFPLNTMQVATGKMYECFCASELQIRVHAAKGLASIIEKYEEAIPVLQPYLIDILKGYLDISEKVDSE